ncbi:flavin reductase family protein [Microbacterium chocolatum]
MHIDTPTCHTVDLTPDSITGSLPADTFKAAFRNHPAGVAVITADPGGEPVAMTVSSLTSISTEPPLVTFSASALSSSTPALERADTVVIHMIAADELWLAKLGATSGIDRFADTDTWSRLATGEPLFHHGGTWIRGRVLHRLTAGNSIVHVVQALDACDPAQIAQPADAAPLVYHNRTWHALGDASVIA